MLASSSRGITRKTLVNGAICATSAADSCADRPGRSDASIGGIGGDRAARIRHQRLCSYGTMRDNVISPGDRGHGGDASSSAPPSACAKKSSARSTNLTRLMIGSEGTLGVIVEVTLRLAGVPEAGLGRPLPVPVTLRSSLSGDDRDDPTRGIPVAAHRTAATSCRCRRARPPIWPNMSAARDADAVLGVPWLRNWPAWPKAVARGSAMIAGAVRQVMRRFAWTTRCVLIERTEALANDDARTFDLSARESLGLRPGEQGVCDATVCRADFKVSPIVDGGNFDRPTWRRSGARSRRSSATCAGRQFS